MAEFTCTRCGKCCISLGRHMLIEKSTSLFSHSLRVLVTGEILPVQVNPAFRDLFLSKNPPSFEPGWCPFLRRARDGVVVCTIHSNRPAICRSFRCCTMRIVDRKGNEAGLVRGRRSLSSADPLLVKIWEEEVMPSGVCSDAEFARRCQEVLEGHGYRCEVYDS